MTDIEGSTRLLQRLGPAYPDALAQHHRIMRQAIKASSGFEVKTEGDSFVVVFKDAPDGLQAAVTAQRALTQAEWPEGTALNVRMGLHTGDIAFRDGQYVGVEIHRASRIASTANGGQVVVSGATRAAAARLPQGVTIRGLGLHQLKDFDQAEPLYQLDIDGLRTDFPPLASLSARFERLPTELSSFVGREREVSLASDLLRTTRLLTMTGPGGTGKTRLALQVARHCQESYRQGVAFVPLAPINDADLVPATIRGALGFTEEPGRGSMETLKDRLHDHEMLLVLDDFEQVLPASRHVADLLAGTRQVSVLVTSRAALHLAGEQELAVLPLALPHLGRTIDLEALAATESVALFVERAQRIRPDFRLDAANARSVALICERLDGLPLAIELAAARIKLLPPDQLLARLSRRLEILETGGGGVDRRRTLRGTIDLSHDLLDPPERVQFRRLAVFTGGATLEAIESVTRAIAGADGPVIADVLAPLGALVDHSLVYLTEAAGEPRYAMLQTIREYGMEQLGAAGEATRIEEAHARWFLARVEERAPRLTASPEALDEIEVDRDNVRAAVRWAIDHGQTELALRAAGWLWRFWHLRGHLREGLATCETVLDLPGVDPASEASARALYARASLLYWQGRPQEARDGYLASLEAAQASGSRPAEAEARFALAYVQAIFKEWSEAHREVREAGRLYEALGDQLGATNTLWADGYFSSLEGDWAAAARIFEATLPEVEAANDSFWMMQHRVTLAWTLQRLDRLDEARALMLKNLEGSLELGDRTMEHMAIQGLASIAAQEGDIERALRLAGAVEVIAEETGGQAPTELVIALDAVTLIREQGVPEEAIDRLVAEGRGMDHHAARALARG
ncbi:LuxR family transcriptional regulator [soil metagenome]